MKFQNCTELVPKCITSRNRKFWQDSTIASKFQITGRIFHQDVGYRIRFKFSVFWICNYSLRLQCNGHNSGKNSLKLLLILWNSVSRKFSRESNRVSNITWGCNGFDIRAYTAHQVQNFGPGSNYTFDNSVINFFSNLFEAKNNSKCSCKIHFIC